jgi:hypothetical protein
MTETQRIAMGDKPRRHDVCLEILKVARPGKTAKDRENGSIERNFHNKRMRQEWYNDHNATNNTFPRDTCNGHKNKYIK